MPSPPITIDERMHSVSEVAELSGFTSPYVLRLVEAGELEAIQPMTPSGRKGRWRVYPKSLRQWLGVSDPRKERRLTKKAKQEAAAFSALCGVDPTQPSGR